MIVPLLTLFALLTEYILLIKYLDNDPLLKAYCLNHNGVVSIFFSILLTVCDHTSVLNHNQFWFTISSTKPMLLATLFQYCIFSCKLGLSRVLPGTTKNKEILPQKVAKFFMLNYCYPVTHAITK